MGGLTKKKDLYTFIALELATFDFEGSVDFI